MVRVQHGASSNVDVTQNSPDGGSISGADDNLPSQRRPLMIAEGSAAKVDTSASTFPALAATSPATPSRLAKSASFMVPSIVFRPSSAVTDKQPTTSRTTKLSLDDFFPELEEQLRPSPNDSASFSKSPRRSHGTVDEKVVEIQATQLGTVDQRGGGSIAVGQMIASINGLKHEVSCRFKQLSLSTNCFLDPFSSSCILPKARSKRSCIRHRQEALDEEFHRDSQALPGNSERIPVHNDPISHRLSLPMQVGGHWDVQSFVHVLEGWAACAIKKLAIDSTAWVPLLQVCGAAMTSQGVASAFLKDPSFLLTKLGSLDPTAFLSAANDILVESVGSGAATHVGLLSLTSALLFVASIRGLSKHSTARSGNLLGMLATALGILAVAASPGFHGAHFRFLVTFCSAGALGYGVASSVAMEDMPQLVAGFHSFVGLAAVFAGFASFLAPGSFTVVKALEMFAGTAVGALTFTGSVVAAGKLHGLIPGRPIVLENRWLFNSVGAGASLFLSTLFASQATIAGHSLTGLSLLLNTAIWGGLGANMVLPIGGADMPVVVSLLNAFSGLATSAAGFMLSNNLLTITGALVASSGTLLSDIMCRGINRSMVNVLLGGFGTDGGGATTASGAAATGTCQEVSALGFVSMLLHAKRVIIVPGYGLAVARCQQCLAEVVSVLRKRGVVVHFAIHPVAGRLPGHMNVLLAEADVPYDIVLEMDDINQQLRSYDVAIVIGANDIVNPATKTDASSPIYGMPVIEVWECGTVVVLKRSMGTGYSGVDNPLFFRDNVRMLFGDAKQSVDSTLALLRDSQPSPSQGGVSSPKGVVGADALQRNDTAVREEEQDFPPAIKVVGVIRERRSGEQRVSISPSVVPRLRKLGFSILLEAGAGLASGFPDDEYVRRGGAQGVQVAESAAEVLRQANVVLKVNEPLLDEIQYLQKGQTLIGFWNMYETQTRPGYAEDFSEAVRQSAATIANLALVPRVSRAQKMDALTSMANIAGYKAVIDAFKHLPRFSRSSVTASGAVPPARVFVIGVGVAGLSAIATANSLGAKVFANDVRDAAREQVESLGGVFVPVDAQGITGEGAGGYAQEMGQDYSMAQRATYARVVKDVDVVITTAMIPNRAAPILITEAMLETMRLGSVIVDLAASTGGNCVATQRDEVVQTNNGIIVIGETNYPAQMGGQASDLLGNNHAAMLETLGGASGFEETHWQDAVVRPAVVARGGELLWPPPPSAEGASGGCGGGGGVGLPGASGSAPQNGSAPAGSAPGASAGMEAPLSSPPNSSDAILQWIEEHRTEMALSIGVSVALGVGLGTNIPEAELTHLGHFVLSLLIGHFTVAGVTPALHTPLISVTNAISGIIVVGGMLQLSGPLLSARVGCALAAVFLSSVNIVGGFAVTHRMLEMFREDKRGKA